MKKSIGIVAACLVTLLFTSCGNETDPQPLMAEFSTNKATILSGEQISFTDQSTGDKTPTSWKWTFEGGIPETSTEQHPKVLYKGTGKFSVSLEVTNDNEVKSTFTEDKLINVTCEGFNCDQVLATRNVAYGIDEDQHLVNVFEPAGNSVGERNLILLFGGGGGTFASNLKYIEPLALQLVDKGFVVGVARYRVQQSYLNFTITGQQDSKAAVRYFRNDATKWNIEPDNIFIGGNSSGAVLSLLHAYVRMDEGVEGFEDLVESLGGWEGKQGSPGISSHVSGVISLTGVIYGGLEPIESTDPPIFAIHGDNDSVSPCDLSFTESGLEKYGSCKIVEKAEEVGLKNGLFLIEGGNHDTPRLSPALYIAELSQFLAEVINE